MKPISTTIIPAQPGYFVVGIERGNAVKALELIDQFGGDASYDLLMKEPIIAWRIDLFPRHAPHEGTFCGVTAITPTGECTEDNIGDYGAILGPDGSFARVDVTHEDLRGFLSAAVGPRISTDEGE